MGSRLTKLIRRSPISRPQTVALAVVVAGVLLATTAQAQISAAEYAERRARLMEALGDGVYYFEAAGAPADDYSVWGQEAFFHYLTGFDEPNARLLMVKSGEEVREILFVRERNPAREIWEGHRFGVEGAAELTGMECQPISLFDTFVQNARWRPPERSAEAGVVVALSGPSDDETVAMLFQQQAGVYGRDAVGDQMRDRAVWINPRPTLRRMRSIKSPAEIELLQIASTITREAHIAAMQAIEPGMNEFEIQALIEYSFRRYGAGRPGFASIVGSGPNSTVLHYNSNDRFMAAGDMIVMDIGAEYDRYTTDVTRSVPVSGKFTEEQRQIYEIVLEAQLAAEEMAREIGVSRRDLSREANRVLAAGLARLGLIESADATLPGSRQPQARLFTLHGLGHGIGLDVHDPNNPTVEIGYAFTIEPGLYIREDALDRMGEGAEADALRERLRPVIMKYKDIGVRIEDSYAYTDEGLVRLSAGIPRTAEEVEATMAEENFANHHRLEELVEKYRQLQREQR
jgi:Xaa-Pro aminopeptidase